MGREEKKKPTLREIRQEHCLSVGDVCRILGIRENNMYRWERGEICPDLATACALAAVFRVRVEDIDWWPGK